MATAAEISLAAWVLQRGGIVAVPTETVYGLAADALNAAAVGRIFELKGRPASHPLIVHLPAPRWASPRAWKELLDCWAVDVPQLAVDLADAFWPGPLTLILRRSPFVSDVVTGGLDTVGLRVPAHPVAQALLAEFASTQPQGRAGLAAPSANRFGHISPTTARHVKDEFGDDLVLAADMRPDASALPPGVAGLILDGGPADIGIESTILDLSQGWLRVLRPGAIGLDDLHAVLAKSELAEMRGADLPEDALAQVRAPGSLPVHYAPRAALRLLEEEELPALLSTPLIQNIERQAPEPHVPLLLGQPDPRWGNQRMALIAPVDLLGQQPGNADLVIFPLGSTLDAQARSLYSALREADAVADVIYAVLPPPTGIGIAIRDRLRRAAGQGDETEPDGP